MLQPERVAAQIGQPPARAVVRMMKFGGECRQRIVRILLVRAGRV